MTELFDRLASATATEAHALLLGMWRETRDPALSAAMRGVPPGRGYPWVDSGCPADLDMWAMRVEVGAATPGPEAVRFDEWSIEALQSAARLPPNPALADGVLAALPKWTADSNNDALKVASELLRQHGDPEHAARARSIAPDSLDISVQTGALSVAAHLDEADSARLAALAPRFRPATHAADPLFQACLADPDDLGLRRVWADALEDRGDPWGEFATLQLAARTSEEDRARIQHLQNQFESVWLGDLAPWLRPGATEFEAGLPARACVHSTLLHLHQDMPTVNFFSDRWRTLRHLSAQSTPDFRLELLSKVLEQPALSQLEMFDCEAFFFNIYRRRTRRVDEVAIHSLVVLPEFPTSAVVRIAPRVSHLHVEGEGATEIAQNLQRDGMIVTNLTVDEAEGLEFEPPWQPVR